MQSKNIPHGLDDRTASLHHSKLNNPVLIETIGLLMLVPAALYGRWLNGRKKQNLPVTHRQLTLLAVSGVLMIVIGLWSDIAFIRLYVWQAPYTLPVAVGVCLGMPLLFCWLGGVLVWQALRRHQSHWSGSATAEEEWLPRQATRYSSGAFIATTFVNLAIFWSLAYLATVTGQYATVTGQYEVFGNRRTPESDALSQVLFIYIAFAVSSACWEYATRKVNRVPTVARAFVWVSFGGLALTWFSLPAKAILPAMLAGLVGGLVLVKTVKIRKTAEVERLSPLRLGELFQWDAKAFALTLAAVVAGLVTLGKLFFWKDVEIFFLLSSLNAFWPGVILAIRATTGKPREFFLSLLVPLVLGGIAWPITFLIGCAAGCLLIGFGGIRARAR